LIRRTDRFGAVSVSRRWLAVPLLAFVMTGVSACSSDGESAEDYVAPLADTPGVDALAADGSVVPFGEWGVVRYENDGSTIFAIKLVGVVAGEPGDLGDVTVFGVDDLDSMTPYHVAYVWAPLSGDPTDTPTQNLVAYGSDDPVTLALPPSEERCDPPEAIEYPPVLGYEQRGCATSASAGEQPVALVFRGPEGSSEGVSFELPPVD